MNVTNVTDTRSTRIAVFIDFDNVEIGVKSTIGGQFDIGLVLEAIKERGEIVTKIAYSDWKRVGDYSRLLTQHAIRMVQRNMTPGGDKNGADITMALDALEMCFTHDHINAFVIVGGDSDFISLVEKLKQYGRKVIVVGGRQFTSVTMQRNCHEFIAYENLVGSSSSRGRPAERGGRAAGSSDVAKALPIVKRALKVLSEREVTPQLGLLKSTLLQLDSTFSEREYGASSFRDFMEKVAQTGAVALKQAGRSMLVESLDGGPADVEEVVGAHPAEKPIEAPAIAHVAAALHVVPETDEDEETMPASPMSMQDGIRAVQNAINQAAAPPRWPMYVRQAKQFLRASVEGFDERKYGFASVVDLLRAAGKEGVLRIERDRQGAVRVFPGPNLASKPARTAEPALDIDETVDVEVPAESVFVLAEAVVTEVPVVMDAEVIASAVEAEEPNGNVAPGARARRPTRARKPAAPRVPRVAKPRARKRTATVAD
ncbi:MAG TPA: NYN domain-containing protein [Vicinamibacterales bacterium]|nr:NYN domain-containing protein [Vicinamibacterales bacterium]